MPANGAGVIRLNQAVQRPLIDLSGLTLEWRRLKLQAALFRKWWLRRHVPYQPLFVIASYRSGSNLLLSYLAQQPGMAMLSEVLSPHLPIGPHSKRLSPADAINHIRFCLQGERAAIRGCKLMLDQLADCGLTLEQLHAAFPAAKYMVLYRQSLAQQFVSLKAAHATNQYQLRDGQSPKQAEVVIDPAELRRYCDATRRAYSDALQHPWLADRAILLSYEELTADPAGWLENHICPLLGVEYKSVQTPLRKQSTQALADQVANYREVSTLLQSPLCRQVHHLPAGHAIQARAA
jgi:LPS sulfotransferase NodH